MDLASVVPAHQLRRAIERAVDLGLFDLRAVEALLGRHGRRRGTPALRAVLADFARHGETRTRSDLEALLLQLCVDHGLPRPVVNRYDGDREADFAWPDRGLIVEIDGYRHHRSRRAFATDRAKDRAALLAGRRTLRYTGDDLEQEPEVVAALAFGRDVGPP